MGLLYRMHLPASGAAGAPVIFLLHGMGSNEQDLMTLAGAFPDKYAVVSLRAPYELQPGSYEWYQGKVVDGTQDGDVSQLAASEQRIDDFVTALVRENRFDRLRVYLVGFSQGAVMSYEVGLTHPRAYRGVGVMSGSLYGSLKPQLRPSLPLSKMRVFISHGDGDQRIPVQSAADSYTSLMQLGVHPEFHVYPGMGHEINNAALGDLVHWLKFDTPDSDN
ncbi:prolyl oligopeptidase family serine peptidase [Paraburkholderia aspalathi]|nr:PHB depolymerase family esterase [Paraburkholderia aspalathi]MBK3780412.1 prolyl oligopeptidase family serine peptidase [Paraburkholderia aspalathi]